MSWFGGWGSQTLPLPQSAATSASLASVSTEAKLAQPAGSRTSLPSAAGSGGSFAVGEVVEYYSSSQGKWILAKVLRLNPSGTYDLDCKPDVSAEKIRSTARQSADSVASASTVNAATYRVGDVVEYFGATQQRWVTAKVLKVNPSGTFDLDCKPDVLPEKIRRPAAAAPPADGAAYGPGDLVEYFSASQGKWIPAKVLCANSRGTYDLDCKPDVQPDKIRRPAADRVRHPAGPSRSSLSSRDSVSDVQAEAYRPGDVIEYFAASQGKWIPAKVLTANADGSFDLDCKPGVQLEKMRRPAASGSLASGPLGSGLVGTGPLGSTASVAASERGDGRDGGPYAPGELVEYFSGSQGRWIPAKVLSANSRGTYDLDCKPDVSPDKIRRPAAGAQPVSTGKFGSGPLSSAGVASLGSAGAVGGGRFAAGDVVEYLSAAQGTWIPAKVLTTHADGTYDLDCKRSVLAERVRPPTVRQPSPYSRGSAGSHDGPGSHDGGSTSTSPRRVSFGGSSREVFTAAPPKPMYSQGVGSMAPAAFLGSQPVQLLRVRRGGGGWQFEVCPEGADALERHGQRRIAVASICGLCGSGKSFLANLLLERAQGGLSGFQVGAGASRPQTEGVWLWGSADADDDQSPLLAFLDCEGFASVGGDDADHARGSQLMTLCALLSSVLLLNSRGELNEELFRSLALACRLGESIEERGNEAHRPVLLWVLRDFAQQLQDSHGRPMTPDEYLEKTLHSAALSEQDQERNKVTREVRQSFLKFFRHRSCVALAPPAAESQLRRLDNLPYGSLESSFRSGVEQVRTQMISTCLANPKAVGGQPLGCFAFVQLLRQLIAAVNDDRILSMRGAWETVQHTCCGGLADELRASATQLLRTLASGQPIAGGAQLPLTDEALHIVLRDQRHSLKDQWEQRAVGDETVRKEYWQELKETLAREESLVRVQNARLADQRLMEALRAWQEWLGDDGAASAAAAEEICGELGGLMEKMPAVPLSRAGRAAVQAAARRVTEARNVVSATMKRHEEEQRKAVAWGEQAAQQEGQTRSQLETIKAQLDETQAQAGEEERAAKQLQDDGQAKEAELQEARAELQELLLDIQAVRSREHDMKAQHRVLIESHNSLKSDVEQCKAAIAKTDAERLASERCARTAAEAAALERQHLEDELADAKAEVERYNQKIEQERATLQGENEKTRAEHRQRVEDVRKQLEEERKLLKSEQEKTRQEHLRLVEETRQKLEEERKVNTGALDEHKGRLLERERGAGILEGKMQVLTSETASLRQRLEELEAQVRESETNLAKQSQENEQHRAELARARAESERAETEAEAKLRKMAKDYEQRLEDELEMDDRAKPKCGCSIQ